MEKIKTLADLKRIKEKVQAKIDLREKGEQPGELVQVKVAMATCGIAAGSKETMTYFIDHLEENGIRAVVTQTGCMGYCYAEPTVEITKPGKEPIVFGEVTPKRAAEIIEKYLKNDELVEGIIPVNYHTIQENHNHNTNHEL
ncbi:MAG: (2Fe-2S) ferredoxin domain-containing protein [Odoribacteraceae bacterium]|jgi:NADP-reducing hydrogenase subunit HndB|nr:(2Fe-2S) ferredoxin domain-containing protein [Odoribacteraceae bacterium]